MSDNNRAEELMGHPLVQRAMLFAEFAHYGQKRKFWNERYFLHVWRVAKATACLPEATVEMVAAAMLHDTVEDVPQIDAALIQLFFGTTVARYVWALTDRYTREAWPTLNREKRKTLEAQRLAQECWEVRQIKRQDIADNTRDIELQDPGFAKVYRAEKDYIISLFDRADGVC